MGTPAGFWLWVTKMSQFYLTSENEASRCETALGNGPIAINGMVGDSVKTFHGIVQSVEKDLGMPRWRVTMIDKQAMLGGTTS